MLRLGRECGEVEPAIEVVGEEVILRVGRNDLCVPLIQQRKGTPRRTDVDRLPQAVQDQNLAVEDRTQNWREG